MKSSQKITELLLIFEENSSNLDWFFRIGNEDFEYMESPEECEEKTMRKYFTRTECLEICLSRDSSLVANFFPMKYISS